MNNYIARAYSAPKVYKKETPCPYLLVISSSSIKIFRVSKWIDILLQIICKKIKIYLKTLTISFINLVKLITCLKTVRFSPLMKRVCSQT